MVMTVHDIREKLMITYLVTVEQKHFSVGKSRAICHHRPYDK